MKSHPVVWQETKSIALGQLVCCAVMVGIYALIGKFSMAVVLGALAGGFLSTLNFFAMALGADIAASRGEGQEVARGQTLIQMSYLGRMVALFLILALCAKSGLFDLIALVLPLVFVRPILTVREFLRKKGDNSK